MILNYKDLTQGAMPKTHAGASRDREAPAAKYTTLQSVLFLVAVAVTAHELVHAACGVDEFLLAGEEGV